MKNTTASFITDENQLVSCEIIGSKKGLFGRTKYLISYGQKIIGDGGRELYTTRKAEWVKEDRVIK